MDADIFDGKNFLPSIDIAHSINFRRAIEKFWVPIKNAIQCHPNPIETLFDGGLVRVQWGLVDGSVAPLSRLNLACLSATLEPTLAQTPTLSLRI